MAIGIYHSNHYYHGGYHGGGYGNTVVIHNENNYNNYNNSRNSSSAVNRCNASGNYNRNNASARPSTGTSASTRPSTGASGSTRPSTGTSASTRPSSGTLHHKAIRLCVHQALNRHFRINQALNRFFCSQGHPQAHPHPPGRQRGVLHQPDPHHLHQAMAEQQLQRCFKGEFRLQRSSRSTSSYSGASRGGGGYSRGGGGGRDKQAENKETVLNHFQDSLMKSVSCSISFQGQIRGAHVPYGDIFAISLLE